MDIVVSAATVGVALFRGVDGRDAPWAVADFDPAQFLARQKGN